MTKKILLILMGAVLAGSVSVVSADVVLFGHIDTSWDYFDVDGGSDGNNLNCTTCSFGFKGSEDLGNGLKAIFKLDFQYDTTERNNSTGLTDRDQWLGLGGVFGQLRAGTISTVYKSHGAMLDPLYRTAQQQRDRGLQSDLHRGAGENGQGRATNTIRYDTPAWNGLGIGGHYTLQNDDGLDPDTDNPWGIGASWQGGPFLVFADYITSDEGGDDDAWKVGGKFGLGMFSFFAQYEGDMGLISARGGNQTLGSGDGADTWMLGATATLGNSMAYFGWGHGDNGSGDSIASRYNTWQLVATHNMSKRTMFYGGFSQIDCDDQDSDVCSVVSTSGGEDEKLSFGMKHKF
ncbi:MAG: porin [Pseudomonadota bacterium]